MSVFDKTGGALANAFALNGEKLAVAYSLGGSILWQAEALDKGFAGQHCTWRFKKISDVSDPSYTSTAEATPGCNDASWQTVTVPHDWSIRNSFNASSPATYEGGYLDGGDAWYRTSFEVPQALRTRRTLLYFDGVYMECRVWLNGTELGKNYNGYNPFWFDVTDKLVDGINTLAVFVRNQQPSSRWYSGSGIYRPVYLLGTEKAGFAADGLVVSFPNLETEHAGTVQTTVTGKLYNFGAAGSKAVKLVIRKGGADVAEVSQTVSLTAGSNTLSLTVGVDSPALWGIGQPNLYTAAVLVDGTEVGSAVFGYRWTKWDVDTGFSINGIVTKLKGVCMHHDLGCIGAEVNRSAMERQIDSMTAMGANAIRLTHNPGSTLFLELCRDKGVLVVEELFDSWTRAKKTYDFARYFTGHYAEVVETTIRRSINNPAVIMWSLGNEINGGYGELGYTAEEAASVCSQLIAAVKALDTTRPVTMGVNYPTTDNGVFQQAVNPLLDVCGVNYNSNDLSIPHGLGKPCYGSETTSALSSRGIYKHDDTALQCSSMDDDKVTWGDYAGVALCCHFAKTVYSGGMFVWTGWDYIGEPTPFNKYPAKSSYFGICDLAGFPKDIYYLYKSLWTAEPVIHIVPQNWDSWTEGEMVTVFLYSNCPTMELFLNGESLGKKTQYNMDDRYRYVYSVPYAAGTLSAKGYDAAGNVVATDEVKTSTGTAAKLALTSYTPTVDVGTDDLVFITCDVLDENGVFVPSASTKVTFSCEGGTVLGTDNGHGACVELMRTPTKSAFSGKVLCVCRHNGQAGTLTVTATADGCEAGSVSVAKERT